MCQRISDITFWLLVLLIAMLAIVACAKAGCAAPGLPSDPFQRCATKAVRGDYGRLAYWQRVGYEEGLRRGATCTTRVWATQFFPAEGYDYGEETRSGYGCSLRVAAATAIPLYSFVWTGRTGIRQVLDTGSPRNDRVARGKGARMWIDFWVWHEGDYGFVTRVMPAAVIMRRAEGR